MIKVKGTTVTIPLGGKAPGDLFDKLCAGIPELRDKRTAEAFTISADKSGMKVKCESTRSAERFAQQAHQALAKPDAAPQKKKSQSVDIIRLAKEIVIVVPDETGVNAVVGAIKGKPWIKGLSYRLSPDIDGSKATCIEVQCPPGRITEVSTSMYAELNKAGIQTSLKGTSEPTKPQSSPPPFNTGNWMSLSVKISDGKVVVDIPAGLDLDMVAAKVKAALNIPPGKKKPSAPVSANPAPAKKAKETNPAAECRGIFNRLLTWEDLPLPGAGDAPSAPPPPVFKGVPHE